MQNSIVSSLSRKHIENIFVKPNWRKRGFASRLIIDGFAIYKTAILKTYSFSLKLKKKKRDFGLLFTIFWIIKVIRT